MNWGDLLTVLVLGLAGLLVGGAISLWSTNRFLSGVLGALAALAAVWAVLRFLPA